MKTIVLIVLSFMASLAVIPVEAQERPHEKAFKGMELYSWKNSSGDWVFALLPGTNRTKPETEIKQQEQQIPNTKELEMRLSRLAEGEQVFWFHPDHQGFSYPDPGMIDGIISLAKKAKVELHGPPKAQDQRKSQR